MLVDLINTNFDGILFVGSKHIFNELETASLGIWSAVFIELKNYFLSIYGQGFFDYGRIAFLLH